jgi:hemoglobin
MTSEPCESEAVPGTADGTVEQITRLVHLFYSRVHDDPLMGPIFDQFIHDWDVHLVEMVNFWSTHLLGAGTYRGNGFSQHMKLPLEEAHFARWLELWEKTASEVLPPAFAQRAIGRAKHFEQSYKTGLLPYKRPDGSLSRTPT